MPAEHWPELPVAAAKQTYQTVHRYLQIVGKIKLAKAPMLNHWWQVPLYLTSRGLTTSAVPDRGETFDIDLDFIDHSLQIQTSRGERKSLKLEPRPVAEFYRDLMSALHDLGIEVQISDVPCEIPDDVTPFSQDTHHAAYDPEVMHRFWRALMKTTQVFAEFRASFTGKCSPVHFFWGSFDLAVTRFCGRRAPERAEEDAVTREAYCEEVSSVGFWPGSEETGGPAYYAYHVPPPPGYRDARVRPAAAYFDGTLKEFLLPYEAVRTATSPREALLEFCQSTYEAGAQLSGWERPYLERPLIRPNAARPGSVQAEQPNRS